MAPQLEEVLIHADTVHAQHFGPDPRQRGLDRTFGRPRNAVVLPAGWYLTASSIPAMVSETPDGRIRLDFVNPRPDEIAVLIKARRRP